MADSVGNGFPSTGIQEGHLFWGINDKTLWEYLGGVPQLASSWKLLNGNLQSQPDTSLWGSEQAGATWIFNEVFYGWDGTRIVRMVSGEYLYNYHKMSSYQADFVGSGNLGDFVGFNGARTNPGNVLNRVGIVRLSTTAVINTIAGLALGNGGTVIDPQNAYNMVWVVRPVTIDANTTVRVGIMESPVINPPTRGIYFEKLDGDVNWFSVVRNAGIENRVDTGVPIVSEFVDLEFRSSGGIGPAGLVQFLVNGVVVPAPAMTNFPTTSVRVNCQIVNSVAADKSIDIDYFEMAVSLNR